MDLDFWDCFGRKKTLSYKPRNTVQVYHQGKEVLMTDQKERGVSCWACRHGRKGLRGDRGGAVGEEEASNVHHQALR